MRILFVFVFLLGLVSCGGGNLERDCECWLKGGKVGIGFKGKYYWISVDYPTGDGEYDTDEFGPYSNESHAYEVIRKCEEFERNCSDKKE